MTQPIPQGVFWVYLTDRFHDLETRADMGDEFAAMWLPRREEFPMSARADSPHDGIHPSMAYTPKQFSEDVASVVVSKAQGKTLRDLVDDVDRFGSQEGQEP